MINLTIQISGKTKQDLIVACDGVASRMEEQEEYAKAEAPDGSGKYSFQIHGDAEPFIFGTHKDVKFMSQNMERQVKRIRELEKDLADKNNELTSQIAKATKEIEEAKRAIPKQPSRRMRTY